jgi:ATP-dependent DNA ligase
VRLARSSDLAFRSRGAFYQAARAASPHNRLPVRLMNVVAFPPLAGERQRPAGFIKPCAPTLSHKAPSRPQWFHEIKHDGYRILAVKRGDKVRLWSPNGRDWSGEFTAITDSFGGCPIAQSTARRARIA